MKTRTKAGLSVVAAGVIAFAASALPAYAEYAPGPSDVVGVGGDTPQYDLNFGADGDTLGDPGYNTAGNPFKLVTFNATPDANGRAVYDNTGLALDSTDVLRAGTNPQPRITSSGASIPALLADTGNPETINFVFTSTAPTQNQLTSAASVGGLHTVQLGTDAVTVAAATSSNAPTTLDAADLYYIYSTSNPTWNSLPDHPGASTDTIIPLTPPGSSAVTKTFFGAIDKALPSNPALISGSTLSVNADVKIVQQNDPTAVTGQSTPADAIVPFSLARLNLLNSKYFRQANDSGTVNSFPDTTVLNSGIVPVHLASTGSDNFSQNLQVFHWVVFRQKDLSDGPWQPGSTKNWAQTLFSSSTTGAPAFFATAAGAADLAAAGITPAYVDQGTSFHVG